MKCKDNNKDKLAYIILVKPHCTDIISTSSGKRNMFM